MAAVRLIILGRQGSGKGTQCVRLVEAYGPVHVSTGDMLRSAVAEGTELGLRASALMDAGDLVPDDVMIGIVVDRLAKPDVVEHGFLLDGFPRTPAQAEALEEILSDTGADGVRAFNIEVPVDEAMERMLTSPVSKKLLRAAASPFQALEATRRYVAVMGLDHG